MFRITWLTRTRSSRGTRKPATRPARTVPRLEALEDRCVPAVTASGDSIIAGPPNALSRSTGVASADGRFVAFTSTAPDLIAGQVDANNDQDVFLYDRLTNSAALVSHTPDSPLTAGNQASANAAVSGDGRYVAFTSTASNLVPGEPANPGEQVYLYSRLDGTVRLVSHVPGSPTTPGTPAAASFVNHPKFPVAISDDGRYVAFISIDANLVSGQTHTNGSTDIFLYDRVADTVTLVSHQAGAPATGGGGESFNPLLSGDGRYLVYFSYSQNLIAGQVSDNPLSNVYLYDRVTGTNILVNHVPGNPVRTGNENAIELAISRDGNFIAFTSIATDLVAGETGANSTVENTYLYDRAADTMALVSHAAGSPTTAATVPGLPGAAAVPALSDDGHYVVFTSGGTNLVPGEVPGTTTNVFLYDRTTGTNRLVSGANGSSTQGANNISFNLTISGDGRLVGYTSSATDIVPGATDSSTSSFPSNAYLFDRGTGATRLVSHTAANAGLAGNGLSENVFVTDNASAVIFTSFASDIAPAGVQDTNGKRDVFVYDPTTGNNTVLTLAGTALLTPTVYVNAAWAGLPPGTDPDGPGPATAIGVDAFATIQQGLDAVPWGGIVQVAPGTYSEHLTMTRSAKIRGSGPTTVVQGPGSGVGLTITAPGAEVSGLTVRGFAAALTAGGGTGYLALTDVSLVGNTFGASVNGVHTFLFGGGAADETFFARPGLVARQGDEPIAVSGVPFLTVDGGGGSNRLVVFLDDISTADIVWFTGAGIARDRAAFLLFYRATGGGFGGGIAVALGSGNETAILQGQLPGAPTAIYANGGDDRLIVSVTSASAYANVTLDGGPGTDSLELFDPSGSGQASPRAVATAGGQGRVEISYPNGSFSVVFYQNLETLPPDLPVVLGS